MFIDVTRYGGMRLLRVNVGAIAYLDTVEDGAVIRLIGGESLRVNEDPGEIEHRVETTLSLTRMSIVEPEFPTMDEVVQEHRHSAAEKAPAESLALKPREVLRPKTDRTGKAKR